MKRSLRNIHLSVWVMWAIALPLLVALAATCIQEPIEELLDPLSEVRPGTLIEQHSCDGVEFQLLSVSQQYYAQAIIQEHTMTPGLYLYFIVTAAGGPDTIPIGPLANTGTRYPLPMSGLKNSELLLADAIRGTIFCSIPLDL